MSKSVKIPRFYNNYDNFNAKQMNFTRISYKIQQLLGLHNYEALSPTIWSWKWTSLYAILVGGGMGFIMYSLLVFSPHLLHTCLVKKSFVGIVGLSCFLILGNTIWWKTLTKTSLLCSKHCNFNYYCDKNDDRRYFDMR